MQIYDIINQTVFEIISYILRDILKEFLPFQGVKKPYLSISISRYGDNRYLYLNFYIKKNLFPLEFALFYKTNLGISINFQKTEIEKKINFIISFLLETINQKNRHNSDTYEFLICEKCFCLYKKDEFCKCIEMTNTINNNCNGYIYFLRVNNKVKIGLVKNQKPSSVINRINQLKTGIPFPREDIELLGVFVGDSNTEKSYHERFQKYRIRGSEWFNIDGDLKEFIDKRSQNATFGSL